MFENGCAIQKTQVQKVLASRSLVPTRVSFALSYLSYSTLLTCVLECIRGILREVGQDYHKLFVVDLLHEFEIGIWKSVLTHLIRMLYAIPGGKDRVAILDAR